jgi:hypothetical protein
LFAHKKLREFSLYLPTLDIRRVEEYLITLGFRSQSSIEVLKIKELSDNFLWINKFENDNRVKNSDIDALDDIWQRFTKLKLVDLD